MNIEVTIIVTFVVASLMASLWWALWQNSQQAAAHAEQIARLDADRTVERQRLMNHVLAMSDTSSSPTFNLSQLEQRLPSTRIERDPDREHAVPVGG